MILLLPHVGIRLPLISHWRGQSGTWFVRVGRVLILIKRNNPMRRIARRIRDAVCSAVGLIAVIAAVLVCALNELAHDDEDGR